MKTIADETTAAPARKASPGEKCFSLKNILVPIDFSEPSMEALKYSRALGVATGSVIHAIYVQEPSAIIADLNGIPVSVPPDCELATERGAALDELLAKEAPQGLVYTTASKIGYPADVIKDAAEASHADLIVISTHGRTGLKRLFFGSVTERVIHDAACPVLVLRK